jgi:DNA primase
MYKEQLTKHEAILKCKAMAGEVLIKSTKQTKTTTAEDFTDVYAQMPAAVSRSSKSRAYLESRGLSELNDVGYNPGTLYKGVRQCVVFPLRSQAGEVVSLYGRSITEGKARHFYTSNRQGLYPSWPAAKTTRLVLTESVIDAATILQHTDETVLALYGTNGLGDEHLTALDALPELKELILFFDGDDAGEAAVKKWSEVLHERYESISISAVETPSKMDINGLATSEDPAILAHLVEERSTLFSSSENASSESSEENKSEANELNVSEPQLLNWTKDNLRFTLLGGVAVHPLDRLKVTLKIQRLDSVSPLHALRQQLDLYQDETVEKLARKAAGRLEVGSTKLHTALLELTAKLEAYRASKVKEKTQANKPESWKLTPERREAAVEFCRKANLLKSTNQLIEQTGVIGERTNRMLLWLVFTSRLRDRPLHVISLGGSGTGKTYLQEKIAELIPRDQKLEVTALSENALYYFDRVELKHKLLLIEDLDGAADDKILYAIRELQSKRKITKTIPLKDEKGNVKTVTLCVEGPICLAGTTTRERLYEDNANRSLLIYLDTGKEQREAIMAYQRKVSAGTVDQRAEDQARELLRDIQCVLKPLRVVNPFAEQLALPPEVFKPLRTNAHDLAFIETVTFYQQFQRAQKRDARGEVYVETTLEDIEVANKLLAEVLLAKSDELTKATRQFLDRLKSYLEREDKMSLFAGEVRKSYRLSPATVNRHLFTLVRYGYAKIVGGSRSGGYEYELVSEEALLRDKVENALDAVLDKIKERLGSSRVAQAENEQLKTQTISELDAVAR